MSLTFESTGQTFANNDMWMLGKELIDIIPQTTQLTFTNEPPKPEMYGIWDRKKEGWWVDATGVVFYTYYLNVAKAQYNHIVRIISEIVIARIGRDGEPIFLEENE